MVFPASRPQAQEIVRTIVEEAEAVEHKLSRVGYTKFTKKARDGRRRRTPAPIVSREGRREI